MPNADQLVSEGRLDEARSALVAQVRATPSDETARMFLFQLLALSGEWDKATSQLEALAQLSPAAEMLKVAYSGAIAAEADRASAFAGTSTPPLLVDSAWAGGLAEAIRLFGAGQADEAIELRDRTFADAPDTPGTIDDVRFDWIADADSRFGPTIEAIVAGRWGLIPFDAIAAIKSEGVTDLRDLIWYPVEIALRSGQSVAAFLPARYPGTGKAEDPAHRLARATAWTPSPWGEAGTGQRLWSLSGGEDVPLLSLRSLVFD